MGSARPGPGTQGVRQKGHPPLRKLGRKVASICRAPAGPRSMPRVPRWQSIYLQDEPGEGELVPLFSGRGIWGTERAGNMPKGTQVWDPGPCESPECWAGVGRQEDWGVQPRP